MNITQRHTPTAKPVNPDLRNRLEAYRENGRSNAIIAREIGCSPAAVSTYISDKFCGAIDPFEERAENVLRTESIRKLVGIETIETGVMQTVRASIGFILKTNDFAIIHGPAGIGKSISAAHYVAHNPTTIFVTLYKECCNAHYLSKQIFECVKSRAFKSSRMNRTEWIFDKLTGSNRLILIDNCHRATKAAREWIFDLHDKTKCPVALIGNPKIIRDIQKDSADADQQESRTGRCPEVELDQDEIPDIAERILQRMCPQFATELHPYAVKVASQRGHLRALEKQLKDTLEFIDRGETDPCAAFRAAHTQLIRNYSLA